MAFDDLDQAEQEESASASEDRADAPDSEPSVGGGDEAREPRSDVDRSETVGTPSADSGPTDGEPVSTARADTVDPAAPAFGFEETKQRPLYARQAAWDAFEDALAIEVEATLRRNDVRDTPKRELHDAALHVLAEHADEVADRVLAERGIDR